MYVYSNPERQNDTYAMPDVEVFQLTAEEVLAMDQDTISEYMKHHEFRLASMNRQVFDKMVERIIEDNGITGGWFYQFCFPGCLPESGPMGPYKTAAEATAAAQDSVID